MDYAVCWKVLRHGDDVLGDDDVLGSPEEARDHVQECVYGKDVHQL